MFTDENGDARRSGNRVPSRAGGTSDSPADGRARGRTTRGCPCTRRGDCEAASRVAGGHQEGREPGPRRVSKGGKQEFLGDVVFQADFDGDNRQDWAAIVIDEKEQRYRAYYVLNLTTGPWLDLLFEQRWTQRPSDGVIRNPMFLKRPGDTGIAQRTYNTLTNDAAPNAPAPAERARLVQGYRSVPAVEIWTGQQGYDADYGHIGDMAYCSSTAYYQSGELKKFRACD